MKFRKRVFLVSIMLFVIASISLLAMPGFADEPRYRAPYSDKAVRDARVEALYEQSRQERVEAEQWAKDRNLPVRFKVDQIVYDLMRIENGRPMYYKTMNVNAAISTAADQVRNTLPYNVNGGSLTVGEWDGGHIRDTHQEFDAGRVTIMDPLDPAAGPADHATHVGGTIGAKGTNSNALGMAPSVNIDSYAWNSDEAEMTARGASTPNQAGTIPISNHSYGSVTGWSWGNWSGSTGWHWWFDITHPYDDWFGQYNNSVQEWDQIAYGAPYYLIVKSAGNDRNDDPVTGQTVHYWNGSGWSSVSYNPALHAPGDGQYKNGYDTIPLKGTAKNILTVGAVNDAVSGGSRSVTQATMSSFSGWGPADDGRIKPDVVGNGVGLYSSIATSDTSYDSYNGTSMSSPNITGSATLLIEYYNQQNPGSAMRSSTLKGLIIHTADDLGNPGPDYSNGWGLMNTKAAADLIKADADPVDLSGDIIEGLLNGSTPQAQYQFYNNGGSPFKVTLCWTDPPGAATTAHDDRTPKLVNDLDVRITGPGGSYEPYRLDVNNPSVNATTGDNTGDNVEQIIVPTGATAGMYTVTISHKGSLTNSHQYYSLIVSGDIVQQYTLTVNVVGNGTVALNHPGGTYLSGTVVQLTATPDPGWVFSGWSGDLSGNTNPENLTMDSDKTITATFVQLQGDVDIFKEQSLDNSTWTTDTLDVYRGDTIFYQLTVTNLFNQSVTLTIFDYLDNLVEYTTGWLGTYNTSAKLLEYTTTLTAYEVLTLSFEVEVADLVYPADTLIENFAGVTYLGQTKQSNTVEAEVKNPIPEPAPSIFLGIGLVGILVLMQRRRRRKM